MTAYHRRNVFVLAADVAGPARLVWSEVARIGLGPQPGKLRIGRLLHLCDGSRGKCSAPGFRHRALALTAQP